VYPNFDILTEADLLHEEETEVGRVLTLEKAVQESLVANRDLVTADYAVLAGAQQVKENRAVLLPQIGLGGGAVAIDEDRATISQGVEPERRLTGSIRGSQLIYSETAWRNYSVEKELQNSRVSGRETLRLDTIQAASTAYLNVLRARSVEKIQKDNLKLTRANLERARVRVDIGAAGPEEVYRWENEIAIQRQIVLRDESVTIDRMNDLNRILNKPLRENFRLEEKELADPLVMLGDTRILPYVKNRRNLNFLRDIIVQKGLEISPELQSIDAEIAALERIETAAKRVFWLPDFTLEGDVTEIFQKSGAGSTSPAGLNDTDWTVGVIATFPLFTSGGKTATLGRSREQLTSLRTEREATVERIEQRILSAINLIRASYPSIELSRDAAVASDKNLQLVTDSYERGILSIIDLLDAQNQSLSSNRQASNAVYNFLIDLMTVQRALGLFVFFLDEAEKQIWFQELQEFYQAAESAS
jgi:outer membrane protein TolC